METPSALYPPQCVCPCSDPLWAVTGAGATQVLPTESNSCQGAATALHLLGAAGLAANERSLPGSGQSQLEVSLLPCTGEHWDWQSLRQC